MPTVTPEELYEAWREPPNLTWNEIMAFDCLYVRGQGLRLVAKDRASPYRGGRTLARLKVKQPNYRVEENKVADAVSIRVHQTAGRDTAVESGRGHAQA